MCLGRSPLERPGECQSPYTKALVLVFSFSVQWTLSLSSISSIPGHPVILLPFHWGILFCRSTWPMRMLPGISSSLMVYRICGHERRPSLYLSICPWTSIAPPDDDDGDVVKELKHKEFRVSRLCNALLFHAPTIVVVLQPLNRPFYPSTFHPSTLPSILGSGSGTPPAANLLEVEVSWPGP